MNSIKDIKVLIVDDEPSIRYVFRQYLKRAGYSQIEEAVNGEEGISIADKFLPHVILLDGMMPLIDGINACKEIRGREYGNNVGIIGLSTEPRRYQSSFLQAGVDIFLNKEAIIENSKILTDKIQELYDKYHQISLSAPKE